MENGSALFGRSGEARHKTADFEKEKARMERKIGELTLCVDFLKKNLPSLGFSDMEKMIDASIRLSRKKQCLLLGINRQSTYRTVKEKLVSPSLLAIVDKAYTDFPAFGSRGLAKVIRRTEGLCLTRHMVRKCMKSLGLVSIAPKPSLSKLNKTHEKYPYILKGLVEIKVNQVWATDITYIKVSGGHAYLCAIMDWASRRVLAWRLSNTMDTQFCIDALEEALKNNPKPEIFNTDQGSQFTSSYFTNVLKENGIRISMDGKGRWMDNVMVERLWRTVKYENVYPSMYTSIKEAKAVLAKFFVQYNEKRPHSSLEDQTPSEVYFKSVNNGNLAA